MTWNAESNSAMIDTGIPYEDDTVKDAANNGGTIRLPTDGSKYVPKAGDDILCDDGTTCEVKDVSKFENNLFAPAP